MANYVCIFLFRSDLRESPLPFTPTINPDRPSKFKPDIHVTALGAWGRIRASPFSVEMIAAAAVKTDFPALEIIERPIPPVVIEPQCRKHAQDQEAVEQNRNGQIGRGNHRRKFARSNAGAKGK